MAARKSYLYGAVAFATLVSLGLFTAKPLMAQIKAAFVQNVDEPGRNTYQETHSGNCPPLNQRLCTFYFAAVPAGKRLVLTNVSGYIDVRNGSLPNAIIESNLGNIPNALVFLPAIRGAVQVGGTRMVYNSEVKAYYVPGGTPIGLLTVLDQSDSFADSGQLSLTGYYVSLP